MQSFIPPKRILLGAGPSNVSQRVLDALARPTIGHLDPEFLRMMDEVKELLKYAFQTKNEMTLVVPGPGSSAMEMCFVNLVERGDTVVVCVNGVFGARMKENIERCGGTAIVVEDEWGKPIDINKVREALENNSEAKILAWVDAETSTGVRSDTRSLVRLAHDHGCLTIVDGVPVLGGQEFYVDDWNIDVAYGGSQKCLSCVPGLAPITFGKRAVEVIQMRKTKVQSWLLDLNQIMNYWGGKTKRTYHHTAPVNSLYAMHEALLILREQGLENSWKRHKELADILQKKLESIGFSFFVEEPYRLPQLSVVTIPEGVDDLGIRKKLLDEYNIEIGAGLGPMAGKIWRIGLMGHSGSEENIDKLVAAFKNIL